MGAGRTATKRPDHVPIGEAHTRITENVRRANAGFHLLGAEDVEQVNRPADGHALLYDTTSGLWKVALAPPFLKFNLTNPLTVSASDEDPMGSAGKLILVEARLKTTGSTTTTAILKHTTANGVTTTSVATFSFTSGNHTPTSTPTVSKSFVRSDYWWLDVTAAGTGAAGLVMDGWGTAA